MFATSMKIYKTYLYEFFDESIGESNSYFHCLTLRYGMENENPECWLGHVSELTIDKILEYCWWREDVNYFVEENPECLAIHFTIWKENRNFGEKNWETYCPLQSKRDDILNQIL